jgi:BioD-like phosphotransacetylase family protein
LNRTLFEKEGVTVVGVVANKVVPDKLDQTRHYLTKSFARQGLDLLGVIPYVPRLTWPTVHQVAEALGAQVLNGRQCLQNEVAEIMIGAMTPHNALNYIRDNGLLIVPGDRDDVVLAAVTTDLLRQDIELAGIVLTGGLLLSSQTMDLVARTHIPVLAVETPTYDTTSRIHDMTIKIQETDKEKIRLATSLVRQYVDLDRLWAALA